MATFALRILILNLRCIGVPFGKPEWKYRWQFVQASMIMTLLYTTFNWAQMYQNEKMERTKMVQVSTNPFGTIMDFAYDNIYKITHMSHFAYFSICGYSLIEVLETPLFSKAYPCLSFEHRAIYYAILFLLNLYGIGNYVVFHEYIDDVQFPPNLRNVLIFYTCVSSNTLEIGIFLLIHYFKYGIYQILKQTLHHLKLNQINERQCLQTIRTMVNINQRFYQVCGFILLTQLTKLSFYVITMLFAIYKWEAGLFQIWFGTWPYLHYYFLFKIDVKIQRTLTEIIEFVRQRNFSTNRRRKTVQPPPTLIVLIKSISSSIQQQPLNMAELKQLHWELSNFVEKHIKKNLYQFEMLKLYQEYFTTRIYDLGTLNWSSFVSILLFSWSYFVLIIQTGQMNSN